MGTVSIGQREREAYLRERAPSGAAMRNMEWEIGKAVPDLAVNSHAEERRRRARGDGIQGV
jgi:hypothetical protein